MVKVSILKMVVFMRVIGKMEKLMDLEYIYILMDQDMKVIGKII